MEKKEKEERIPIEESFSLQVRADTFELELDGCVAEPDTVRLSVNPCSPETNSRTRSDRRAPEPLSRLFFSAPLSTI